MRITFLDIYNTRKYDIKKISVISVVDKVIDIANKNVIIVYIQNGRTC